MVLQCWHLTFKNGNFTYIFSPYSSHSLGYILFWLHAVPGISFELGKWDLNSWVYSVGACFRKSISFMYFQKMFLIPWIFLRNPFCNRNGLLMPVPHLFEKNGGYFQNFAFIFFCLCSNCREHCPSLTYFFFRFD